MDTFLADVPQIQRRINELVSALQIRGEGLASWVSASALVLELV